MDPKPIPTFGRVLGVLRGLGFSPGPAAPGVLALVHPDSGAEFLFRARPDDPPARANELANLRMQLTARGLVTDAELDALLAPAPEPAAP